MKLKGIFLAAFIFIGLIGQSQALMILIFGDKLSNERMQSGINVFVTQSTFNGMSDATVLTSWALGGFTDIKLKNNWYASIELTVKSPTGAKGLLNYYDHYIPNDSITVEDLHIEITNFSVPLYIKYKTKYFNIAAGPEMIFAYASDLVYTAKTIGGENIAVKSSAKEYINTFDIGFSGTFEFLLFPKRPKTSVRLGLRYYYGFISPLKDYAKSRNSVLMFKVGIPIAGKDVATLEEVKNVKN
ncbi:MAG: hypothetical protein DRI86_05745 [Bacteroidetes bacterium]|nr:MAG: hypothetical protein DRI86_05745 [Bacteroidota bacterium]